ncbi:hypothetical protein AB205_0143060, partial [Aquarana catesbeiana]
MFCCYMWLLSVLFISSALSHRTGEGNRMYGYNPAPAKPEGIKRPISKTAMHQIRRQSNAQSNDEVLTLSSSSESDVGSGAKKTTTQANANDSDDVQTISSGSDVDEDKKNTTATTGTKKAQRI